MSIAILIVLLFLVLIGIATLIILIHNSFKKHKNIKEDNLNVLFDSLNTQVKNIILENLNILKDEINKNNIENEDRRNEKFDELKKIINNNLEGQKTKFTELNENNTNKFSELKESLNDNFTKLKDNIADQNNKANEVLVNKIEAKITDIDKKNNEWFENIKKKIDEHFEDKLTKHIKEQFQNIKTSMDEMNKGMTQFETVQQSVIDLNKVFKSNKNIGTYGEFSLSQIFEHVFSDLKDKLWFEQYALDPSSSEKVDFAIKSISVKEEKNGPIEQDIIIPIDSKFPLESWRAYDEKENGSEKSMLFKEFKNNITEKAKSISTKYVKASNNTTPWAIMYLPAETIYLELIKNDPQFVQNIFHNHKIFILGPTSIMAFIYNFSMQKEAHNISKQIDKIRDLFVGVQDTYFKLTKSINESIKGVDGARKKLLTAQSHSDAVMNKINKQAKELSLEKKDIERIKLEASDDEK
ncbi:rmuC [Mycoplasmopsis californica]|uniref:DNA recombination protein RmuC n=1 Tax=Mycoplasmopsis californica TaxID=2113 RepID=UPI000EB66249|nr:DNA recombination protein RmuC [Mycoplasmopsis californica]BBG40738.1 rmuC [Mycoplasmopsis californica]BBG41332.1 rmuC [Mycoplasmopsis californica]BBG41925.1 rmuC [Mycoplasmopsis californica]